MISNPNRCGCISTEVISPCDHPNDECCLTVCNILADKETYPCGDSRVLDITKFIKIPSCCDNSSVQITIKESSNNLKDVVASYNYTAKLFSVSYTSNYDDGKDYKSAKIVYQVKCGLLRLNATIIIPFKQHNENPDCPSEHYNPCTGDCIEIQNEVSIGSKGNEITIS
jgi:hypothetical protein